MYVRVCLSVTLVRCCFPLQRSFILVQPRKVLGDGTFTQNLAMRKLKPQMIYLKIIKVLYILFHVPHIPVILCLKSNFEEEKWIYYYLDIAPDFHLL